MISSLSLRYRRLAALLGLALLTGCSFAPLPLTVDLLARFPDRAEGSFSFSTPTVKADLTPYLGEFRASGFTLPGLGLPLPGITLPVPRFLLPPLGAVPLAFPEVELPGSFEEASVDYRLRLEHGGNLGGGLRVQVYLAPDRPDAVDQPAYALGGAQVFSLNENSALITGSVPLGEAQFRGIAEKRLRLALALEGEVTFNLAGETAFRYSFETFDLNVKGLTVALDERLPDADGANLDFSGERGPGRVVGLGLDYALTLEHDSALGGSVAVQVYVAPPGEDSLWQDRYAFGEPKTLDLAERAFTLEETAFLNEAQRDLLNTRTLRIGVRLTGEPSVRLGEEVRVAYRFTRLLLRVNYAL